MPDNNNSNLIFTPERITFIQSEIKRIKDLRAELTNLMQGEDDSKIARKLESFWDFASDRSARVRNIMLHFITLLLEKNPEHITEVEPMIETLLDSVDEAYSEKTVVYCKRILAAVTNWLNTEPVIDIKGVQRLMKNIKDRIGEVKDKTLQMTPVKTLQKPSVIKMLKMSPIELEEKFKKRPSTRVKLIASVKSMMADGSMEKQKDLLQKHNALLSLLRSH